MLQLHHGRTCLPAGAWLRHGAGGRRLLAAASRRVHGVRQVRHEAQACLTSSPCAFPQGVAGMRVGAIASKPCPSLGIAGRSATWACSSRPSRSRCCTPSSAQPRNSKAAVQQQEPQRLQALAVRSAGLAQAAGSGYLLVAPWQLAELRVGSHRHPPCPASDQCSRFRFKRKVTCSCVKSGFVL